jgi:methylated-DNA-[protein]-cysteine S-methyltransferase
MISLPDFGKKMQKPVKYVIFPTKWGYCGFAGTEKGLLRTCLPAPKYEEIETRLLQNSLLTQFSPSFFKHVQNAIAAYFTGGAAHFSLEIPLDLTELTPFQATVLTACRRVGPGRTITYGQLAKRIGKPKAARVVGNALAKNPLPLIIPCHRILPASNRLGGFSAPGGIELKARMLRHEQTFRH